MLCSEDLSHGTGQSDHTTVLIQASPFPLGTCHLSSEGSMAAL